VPRASFATAVPQIARPPEGSGAHAPQPCFHCGLPVTEPGRYVALVDGTQRDLCCTGCQAVTETILGSGLAAFYASRTAVAAPSAGRDTVPLPELAVYDRPEVQAGFVERGADGMCEATLLLEGIRCAACVWLNEQHLASQPGVLRADINYATRRAHLSWDPARIRLSDILAAVQAIGYRAWPNDNAAAEALDRREGRDALWRLFVAAFGMMQVMMYAFPAYIAMDGDLTPDIAGLLRWASLLLTVPVVFYAAAPFFRGAWRDLRAGRAGMDVPVALGIGAAFLGSVWATVSGQGEVYFDSVSMFVFFLLGGRWLEAGARRRAVEVLRHLSRALPATAERLHDWPARDTAETVPAIALAAGDHVLVRPGAAFPADGVLVQGETRADESLLTGEALPVAKRVGHPVVGGAVNASQPVVVRVERAGNATRLGAIVRLAERSHGERPALVALADRYASAFVIVVLALAGLAATAWWWHDPSRALAVAVAVLVVTCPCALSLATPTALTVGTGALAKAGLIVTRERAIETLTRVTHVVLDKTGTLSEGVFSLVSADVVGRLDETRCRALAAAMEAGSDHPVARALRDAPTGAVVVTDVRHIAGEGVEALWEGRRVRLGSRRHVEALAGPMPAGTAAMSPGITEVWLADEAGPLMRFALGDRLRPEAAEVVRRLRAANLVVILASGDGAHAVRHAASQCGIDDWRAGLSPEDKHRLVTDLQAAGAVVCMVGDGVNDAPVLARADVSIAMGTGAVLAQRASDIVMVSGRFDALQPAFEIAARTMRLVRQNLAWAFAYNVIAIPLAAFGWITPWAAGLGMSASSLFVVVNALRIGRAHPRADRPAPVHAAISTAS
jgi:P-type Cu2+ transporter